MFFKYKMRKLRKLTGTPPTNDRAALTVWMQKRTEASLQLFNEQELLRLVEYDANLIIGGCIPY